MISLRWALTLTFLTIGSSPPALAGAFESWLAENLTRALLTRTQAGETYLRNLSQNSGRLPPEAADEVLEGIAQRLHWSENRAVRERLEAIEARLRDIAARPGNPEERAEALLAEISSATGPWFAELFPERGDLSTLPTQKMSRAEERLWVEQFPPRTFLERRLWEIAAQKWGPRSRRPEVTLLAAARRSGGSLEVISRESLLGWAAEINLPDQIVSELGTALTRLPADAQSQLYRDLTRFPKDFVHPITGLNFESPEPFVRALLREMGTQPEAFARALLNETQKRRTLLESELQAQFQRIFATPKGPVNEFGQPFASAEYKTIDAVDRGFHADRLSQIDPDWSTFSPDQRQVLKKASADLQTALEQAYSGHNAALRTLQITEVNGVRPASEGSVDAFVQSEQFKTISWWESSISNLRSRFSQYGRKTPQGGVRRRLSYRKTPQASKPLIQG